MRPLWQVCRSRLEAWSALTCLALSGLLLSPSDPAHAAPDSVALDYRLQARALAPDVYVVEGANADFDRVNGCNIINTGFIVTGAGVLVINSGPSRLYGKQLRALIARTTAEPILKVLHLNQHPDYFLGNQAFVDVPRAATAATQAGMQSQAAGYTSNLYRLCGEWMKGTEAVLPSVLAQAGTERLGRREIELLELRGHTDSDLVLIDRSSGIVFAGGLIFSQRIPTTPHADIKAWQASLQTLSTLPHKTWVPSHGSLALASEQLSRAETDPVAMTQRYLVWLDQAFQAAAEQGLDMVEVLNLPVPAEFRRWAGFASEYTRNVANLYPRYEQAVLRQGKH